MEWHGFPPEVNTGRMIAGAGAEPYLQAQAGWQALAADFTAALTALRTQISAVSAMWQGMASAKAQAAFEPYLAWMTSIIAMAQHRAAAAEAQAATYGTAVAITPTLAEVASNHITHAVLEGTNFMGVNAIPIAVNEFDYFVVLWNRAAGAMDGYLAGTEVNTTFPPFPSSPHIMGAPGAPEAGLAAILSRTAAQLPATVAREALLAELQAAGTEGAARGEVQEAGQAMATTGNLAGSAGREAAQIGTAESTQAGQMGTQMATQMATQGPQLAAQVPQQLGQVASQGPQQLMQVAAQPMQQITSLFHGMSPSDLAGQNISPSALASHFGSMDQLGAYGTSAVGSAGGGYSGAGLLSAAHSGGASALRAPVGWSPPAPAPAAPVEQVARTTATPTGAGSGAVGAGSGMMGPMAGAHGRGEGSAVALDEPVADEREVVTTLGFDVFDEESRLV